MCRCEEEEEAEEAEEEAEEEEEKGFVNMILTRWTQSAEEMGE